MATSYGDHHGAVAAWFLGPHAENSDVLETIFRNVLYITPDIKATNLFQKNIKRLKYVVGQLAPRLAQHSVPFWNPRYNAHMNMDTTMPGIAGYLMAMMFNPNNVTTEASPLTTILELQVGQQLCKMVGFNVDADVLEEPVGWGHITCDGSVANLEAMWAARNLKYYPLSVRLAMKAGGPLAFIADKFYLPTCQEPSGSEGTKLLKDFTPWELLNITPDVVLDIPDRLRQQFFMTPAFLQAALDKYLIQTVSKDSNIFREFEPGEVGLNKMAYFTSATKHYSWPKATAVTGIGSENLIDVQVDNDARLDVDDLRKHLEECLRLKRAVYTVVAIIGSTEHGACDPLFKIVELRNEFRHKGLSFVLHADAAWGAYFASALHPRGYAVPTRSGFVPSIALKPSTIRSLESLHHCDSITVDPHKSGYIQYPAGGLLYRDQRMRYLITWTSPYIYRGELESIGVYGIEGSKPGAAAVATWVSHEVIGLHQEGYGALLGEAVFSCVKMYAHLATMSTDDTDFIVVPLNALPTDVLPGIDVKEFIRERILPVSNKDLVKDNEAMKLIQAMGSDLAINAFVVNFRVNGKTNEDIIEANNLGKRIFEKLSISSVDDRVQDRPLILTSTQFSKKGYGKCLENLKERLGLIGEQDLYVLDNVVMSPFPTDFNFTKEIIIALRKVIEAEVVVSQFRNTVTADMHSFVMQGTDQLFLVYLPMFNMANHRYQLIITGDIPKDAMDQYKKARAASPKAFFILGTAQETTLEEILSKKKFSAVIDKGLSSLNGSHFITGFELNNIEIVVKRHLDSVDLYSTYPKYSMPFYIYGTKQLHIDHVLFASPNAQLNSDQVKLELELGSMPFEADTTSLFCCRIQLPEQTLQPFPSNKDMADDTKAFFRPGVTYDVAIFRDTNLNEDLQTARATGKLTLGECVFADTDMLNEDPLPSEHGMEMLTSSKTDKIDTGAESAGGHIQDDEPLTADAFISHRLPIVPLCLKRLAVSKGWQNLVTSFACPE